MDVCSFGRSFLDCRARRGASARFAFRVLLAARARWPEGRLSVDRGRGSVRWMVDGSCGVMVSGAGRCPAYLDALRSPGLLH